MIEVVINIKKKEYWVRMSNITFLVSAVLTVFLLQGVEQTRLVSTVVKTQVSAPDMVLDSVKNRAFSLKTTDSIHQNQIDNLNLTPETILTKS